MAHIHVGPWVWWGGCLRSQALAKPGMAHIHVEEIHVEQGVGWWWGVFLPLRKLQPIVSTCCVSLQYEIDVASISARKPHHGLVFTHQDIKTSLFGVRNEQNLEFEATHRPPVLDGCPRRIWYRTFPRFTHQVGESGAWKRCSWHECFCIGEVATRKSSGIHV